MPTNEQVFLFGIEDDSWPVDINPETGETESNGAQQWRFFYEGTPYLIITNWEETVLYRPDSEALVEPGYVESDQ